MSDEIARRFHATYERLAPSYGYETRRESAVPWESVPERNRRLMSATCDEVVGELVRERDAARAEVERLRAALRRASRAVRFARIALEER